ncbi:plasmid replication protein RepC [Rhizobium puerariae]|uniref:Plasmid replication protein RepC n=1 Tax=Rhizobium puerariae TaxID=1585791 RepID=A0ABV6AFL1_9HYPH
MRMEHVTTPFGRRSVSFGLLISQQAAGTIEPGIRRNKWKLFRAICEARPALGVSDRALTVLDALLTFYPDDEISEERGLVVFPSNTQLSLRARGMTPATLRRHIAVLVDAGLILRKDSPNGKRYARRGRTGQIDEAFGFSLAPLLARAAAIEHLAAEAAAERERLRITKERFTICRRDISKLVAAAITETLPGDWTGALAALQSIFARLPRKATTEILAPLLDEIEELRASVINQLKLNENSQKIGASESQIERHKQDSQTQSPSESEPAALPQQKTANAQEPVTPIGNDSAGNPAISEETPPPDPHPTDANPLKSFPLAVVLRACPQIADYGPQGEIRSWRDLMSAAIVVRSMLDISQSAHEEASTVLGAINTATVIACILERAEHISSAGGYLRDLTQRAARGQFSVGPMLMALLRSQAAGGGELSRAGVEMAGWRVREGRHGSAPSC